MNIDENLFYNRNRNISITGYTTPENLSSLNLTPVYGSKVNFSCNNSILQFNDSNYTVSPKSLNSLSATYQLRYDVEELDAQKLADFFESKLGYLKFNFNPDNYNIYKEVSAYCDRYSINHINKNHYEFAVEISSDQAPLIFNWANSTFLNNNLQNYTYSKQYSKYEVVYFSTYKEGDNLLTSPNNFAHSSWTTHQANVLPDNAEAPDGSLDADKLRETATTQQHLLTYALPSVVVGSTYTLSVYAKAVERSKISLTAWGEPYIVFDLTGNGSIVQGNNASITFVGKGWYKCSATFTKTNTTPNFYFLPWNNGASYLGVAGYGLLLWGASLSVPKTNKLNNFFYCTQDHYSDLTNSPNNIDLDKTNYLVDYSDFSTTNWQIGSLLGSFFTTSQSNILTPNNNLTATKFTSTASTSEGLFLRAYQSMPANKYILSIYLYVPTQAGVNNWGLLLDGQDSANNGSSSTQTLFDQWVKISIPIEYTATRSFLDFNIRVNGGAPASSGFIVHAYYASLNLNINSFWSQDFFFEPDAGLQHDVKLESKKLEFKNSFPLRMKTKENVAPLSLNYKFSNITDLQLSSMLHFLENKAGHRKFKHQIPSVYTSKPKIFFCQQWTHTWKYYNSNDLELTLIEDPFGVISQDT